MLIDYWRSPAGGGNRLRRKKGKNKWRSSFDSATSDEDANFWYAHQWREHKKEQERAEHEAHWRD